MFSFGCTKSSTVTPDCDLAPVVKKVDSDIYPVANAICVPITGKTICWKEDFLNGKCFIQLLNNQGQDSKSISIFIVLIAVLRVIYDV